MKNMLVYWSVYGLVELILYVWLFHWIGFWPLFLIQVLSTAFGLFMFRRVGGTLFRNILDGRTVTPYLLDTICFFFAALFFTIPGVLTTLFGLLLFIPFVRKYVKPRLSKWFLSQSKRPSDYYFDM